MTITAAERLDRTETARAPSPILGVRGLTVAYGGDLAHPTVDDVSFDVHPGQTVAVVGESGSGKSTIVNAVLKLLHGRVAVAGSVHFAGRETTGFSAGRETTGLSAGRETTGLGAGRELIGLRERDFRALRGRRIGYVPQDPTAALNPVRRIDTQIFEAYRASKLPEYADPRRHAEQAAALLDSVGIVDPHRALHAHPHELSGGQLQRVLIGIAIAQHPDLVVADEPTSALDVTVQKTILDLIDGLKAQAGLSVLLVTHDLSLAVERSDVVVVLEGGRVQEVGPSKEVLRRPTSPYTRGLVSDVPNLNLDRFGPALSRRPRPSTDVPALRIERVHKSFGAGSRRVDALRGVSFELPQGRTHALVGESGSGKSTLARIALRLLEPDEGSVEVLGADVSHLGTTQLRDVHRNLQLVYQNPFTSLDPTYTVQRLVGEPLRRFKLGSRTQRRDRVVEALGHVGLDATFLARRPRELSGGQRQRVAIARALTLSPRILVLDEPTSALDVSVQAQILDVLVDLQATLGLSYLFISHDLSVVRQIADTVTVLRRGEVQEQGTTHRVFTDPESDYTRALIESIPKAL